MPYVRREKCVYKKDTGEKVGCSPTEEKAKRYMKKLYSLEKSDEGRVVEMTRRDLRRIIYEILQEGKSASKSTGKPYKGSRRGKTESQAQQMAAGIALGSRRKHGKKGAIKKLKGAPKSLAAMSMKDLIKLATIRRGSEVPDSTKKGHERAALPGHIKKGKK